MPLGTSLLRPLPAQSAAIKPTRFVFGPVFALATDIVEVVVTNTGNRPTPSFHVVISDAINGAVLDTHDRESLAPGTGVFVPFDPNTGVELVAMVTFDSPLSGQAVPNPLAATIQVLDGTGNVKTVLGPQTPAGK